MGLGNVLTLDSVQKFYQKLLTIFKIQNETIHYLKDIVTWIQIV